MSPAATPALLRRLRQRRGGSSRCLRAMLPDLPTHMLPCSWFHCGWISQKAGVHEENANCPDAYKKCINDRTDGQASPGLRRVAHAAQCTHCKCIRCRVGLLLLLPNAGKLMSRALLQIDFDTVYKTKCVFAEQVSSWIGRHSRHRFLPGQACPPVAACSVACCKHL